MRNNAAIVLLLLFALPLAYAQACGPISKSITLDSDMQCPGSALTIGSDNITIDCNGHIIKYAASEMGHAISASAVKGITVENCILLEASDLPDATAISLSDVGSSSVINNTISTSGIESDAIFVEMVFNTTIISNNIHVTNATGIAASSPFFLNIENNTINASAAYRGGISILFGGVVSLVSNRIDVHDNYGFGIILMNLTSASLADSDNPATVRYFNLSRVANNNISMDGDNSIGVFISSDLSVEAIGNTIQMNGPNSVGLFAESIAEHTFESNSISVSGNFSNGISLKSSNYSVIRNNDVITFGESSYGVSSVSGIGNIFRGNNVRSMAAEPSLMLAKGSLSELFEGNDLSNINNIDSGFSMTIINPTDVKLIGNRLCKISIYKGNATLLGNTFISNVPKVVTLNVTGLVLSNDSVGNDWGRKTAPFFVRGEDVDDERFADTYSPSVSQPNQGSQVIIGLAIIVALVLGWILYKRWILYKQKIRQ